MNDVATAQQQALPVGSVDRRASGWYGMLYVIATEGALFGYLLFCYFYCAVQFPPSWSPEPRPSLTYALPATVVMLLSSVALWLGQRGLYGARPLSHRIWMALAIVLGIFFVVLELADWKSKPFSLSHGLYSSLYFTTTGIDLVHLLVGIIGLVVVLIWSLLGYIDARRDVSLVVVAAYWHFVTIVWLAVFATFYLTPYLR